MIKTIDLNSLLKNGDESPKLEFGMIIRYTDNAKTDCLMLIIKGVDYSNPIEIINLIQFNVYCRYDSLESLSKCNIEIVGRLK